MHRRTVNSYMGSCLTYGKALAALAAPFIVLLTTAACTDERTPSHEATPQVVTTSNIVADWVTQVGGNRVEVFSLVPTAIDPHSFQPGARDIAKIVKADIIFSIGLTMESAWLDELTRNETGDSSRLVSLGEAVIPITFDKHEHGHEHGLLDPHFWFDPLRVKLAVEDIATKLSMLDPSGSETYLANAKTYQKQLDDLHKWIENIVSQLPPTRRLLITSHDSFSYFAKRYGFRVMSAIIPSVTTEQEPSAAKLAELVGVIRTHQIPAVFTETTVEDRLTQRIAEEGGVHVVRSLYTDSLGEAGSNAESYVGMMRENVKSIVEALR